MFSTLRLRARFFLGIVFLVALVIEHPDTVLTAQPETLQLSYSALSSLRRTVLDRPRTQTI